MEVLLSRGFVEIEGDKANENFGGEEPQLDRVMATGQSGAEEPSTDAGPGGPGATMQMKIFEERSSSRTWNSSLSEAEKPSTVPTVTSQLAGPAGHGRHDGPRQTRTGLPKNKEVAA